MNYHGIGSYPAVVPDPNGPQQFSSCSHDHVVLNGGVALFLFPTGPPQGHPLVNGDVVSNFRGLADDDAQAVVDKKAVSDFGPRMNLDGRKKAHHVGKPTSQELESLIPQPMVEAVPKDGMDAGVAEKDLPGVSGRGVTLLRNGNILFKMRERRKLLFKSYTLKELPKLSI